MWNPTLPPDDERGLWVNLRTAVLGLWQRGQALFDDEEPETLTRRRAEALQWLEERRKNEV